MGRLPLTDAAWLLIESRERPMHVGGLQLFTRPDDAPPDWLHTVVGRAMQDQVVATPYDLVLKEPYGRLGTFAFEPGDVELAYHVRHIALPQPGRIRELLSYCSNVHAATMDRHRPLWEVSLIEGVEGDRFALYTKVHHSLLDGVAAMRQVVKAFSEDSSARNMPAPWATQVEAATSRELSGDASSTLNPTAMFGAAASAATGIVGAVGAAFGATRALGDQFVQSRKHAAEVVPFQAPRTIINQRLTATRRFVAQDYSLSRIKAVGKATGSTVNDVVLAMCSTALREYLLSHDALPEQPLIAMVPVSIRPADGPDHGNALSFVMANLGTHLDDPGERLELVRDSMNAAKRRMSKMSKAELVNYAIAITSPLILGNLTGMSGRFAPLFNVTISNVPGPRNTLYWNGAEMQGLYPASLLQDGYALNITQTSYRDQMAFGITADRSRLPSVQRIIDHLEDGLVELEKLGA